MSSQQFSSSREEVASTLGMSAIFIIKADAGAKYVYNSESFMDILGYTPGSLLGISAYTLFHPDEVPILEEVHKRALTHEETACVMYMRLMHKEGYYVKCAVSYYTKLPDRADDRCSTVYDKTVGTICQAEYGPLTIKQAMTAREVEEVHATGGGQFGLRKWPKSRPSPSRTPSPPMSYLPFGEKMAQPWPKLPEPQPRTAFLIDRFTDTSRVIIATNDIFLKTNRLTGQSFYSIVKPSDRALVREYINRAKSWSPVVLNAGRSGGHGYAEFEVLRIPDLPPRGELYPQGTDDSERHMPGQEFILVEAIFTASSDAVVCIIERIDRKRNRGEKVPDR